MKSTEATPVKHVLATGDELACVVCGFDRFFFKKKQLHSRDATFFNVEWAGEEANGLACAQCGHLHWFVEGP